MSSGDTLFQRVVVQRFIILSCSMTVFMLRISQCQETLVKGKGKGQYSSSCHLPYGITQCYLLPDTSERTLPNLIDAAWYSIYLPRRDRRLS